MSIKGKILGERLEAGQFNENTSEHLHRYALATSLCEGKIVLDIACGDGYGSNMLARYAKFVTGVDIDEPTIALAKEKYKLPNLEYKTGRADKIPCEDNYFDILISFETLEHHDKHNEMMGEIKRVLKPGGVCLISTPDKLVYSDKKNYSNPFHVKELYKDEFYALLKKHFTKVTIFKQQFFSGSIITPEIAEKNELDIYKGDFNSFEKGKEIEAEYLLAVASDNDFVFTGSSIFIDPDFGKNKILQFQNSSLRYKIGNLLLSPIKYLRGRK